ncbi:MAG: hypothetical protein R3E48_16700 [Burkholderiaceae bacterium]
MATGSTLPWHGHQREPLSRAHFFRRPRRDGNGGPGKQPRRCRIGSPPTERDRWDRRARNIISGNDQYGVRIVDDGTDNNRVENNIIGLNATGTAAVANANDGIRVESSGTLSGTTIGGTTAGLGNIISGNGGDGIEIRDGATASLVAGNLIGLAADGVTTIANASNGVYVLESDLNTIGGTSTTRRNVISGNTSAGIRISGTGSTGNMVFGNYVGTDTSGLVAAGNAQEGIKVNNGASGNQIGDDVAGAGNLVSGNLNDGIVVGSAGSDNNVIQNNRVGVDATGNASLSNGDDGIQIGSGGPSGNIVGGSTPLARNIIAGNLDDGVQIYDGAIGTVVQGNYIGVGADGTTAIGNASSGVRLYGLAVDSQIGGAGVNEGNLIAYNALDGVIVLDTGTDGNSILGNSIHSNLQNGIDLQNDGVTANDAGDADTGPNSLQNFPVLTIANSNGGNTYITGALNSTAATTYRIEFFSSPIADVSGYGEGLTYLGFTTVTTDGSGNASIGATLVGVTVTAGHLVSATATVDQGGGNYGDTSEFATNVVATTGNVAPTIAFNSGTFGVPRTAVRISSMVWPRSPTPTRPTSIPVT